MMKYIMFGGYVRFEKRSNRISNIELNRKASDCDIIDLFSR